MQLHIKLVLASSLLVLLEVNKKLYLRQNRYIVNDYTKNIGIFNKVTIVDRENLRSLFLKTNPQKLV